MGLSDITHIRPTKRSRDVFAAAYDKLYVWNYQFCVTFGLTCMTPGEQVIVYLFSLALISATSWVLYALVQYTACVVMRSIALDTEGIISCAKLLSRPMSAACTKTSMLETSLQALPNGDVMTLVSFGQNATLLAAP